MSNLKKLIAARLRNAREDAKLTQSDVAEILGIKRASYTQIETGKNWLTVENLVKLQEILKRPVHYFLGLEENGAQTAKDKLNKMGDHPDIEQISEIWEYLDAAERRNVYDYTRWRLSQQLQRFNSSEKRDRDADRRTMAITDIMFFSHEFSPAERARLITYLQDLDNSSSGAV